MSVQASTNNSTRPAVNQPQTKTDEGIFSGITTAGCVKAVAYGFFMGLGSALLGGVVKVGITLVGGLGSPAAATAATTAATAVGTVGAGVYKILGGVVRVFRSLSGA